MTPKYNNVTIEVLKYALKVYEVMEKNFEKRGAEDSIYKTHQVAVITMRNMIALYESKDFAIVPIKELEHATALSPGKRTVLMLDAYDSPCPFLPMREKK